MFVRDWDRLRRLEGWRPYGLIAVALLAAAILADDLYAEYDTLATRLQDVESALTLARDKAERAPQLAQRRQEADVAFAGVSSRLVPAVASDPGAGADKFGQSLRAWYESKGISQVAIRSIDRRQEDGVVWYRAEVEAAMRVEQLVGLLQGRAFAPMALRLERAAVDANDAVAPTGLRTAMTWEGVQAPPPPVAEKEAKPAADKKSEKGSPKPSERNREAKGDASAVKILEEKRK